MRRRPWWLSLVPALLAALVPGAGHAGDRPAGDHAPLQLDGLHRSAIVAMLGEPDKAKRSDEGETLVYKLLTVADDHLQAPDERMIDLPGLGRCVHHIPLPTEGYDDKLEFEPTHYNEKGQMEGGSLSRSQTHSVTKKIDEDEPTAKPEKRHDARTGKARLFITLGRDGTVLAWHTKGGR